MSYYKEQGGRQTCPIGSGSLTCGVSVHHALDRTVVPASSAKFHACGTAAPNTLYEVRLPSVRRCHKDAGRTWPAISLFTATRRYRPRSCAGRKVRRMRTCARHRRTSPLSRANQLCLAQATLAESMRSKARLLMMAAFGAAELPLAQSARNPPALFPSAAAVTQAVRAP